MEVVARNSRCGTPLIALSRPECNPCGVTPSAHDAEDRRRETALRIVRHARELAHQHGADGFTMDQLADRVGVSRRTLFNYFPGKYDAIIGDDLSIDPGVLATFRAGGPTGELIEDMLVVADSLFAQAALTVADARQMRSLLEACPPLVSHVLTRLEEVITCLAEDIVAREGSPPDARTARGLLATFAVLGQLSVHEYAQASGDHTPGALLRLHFTGLRHLLAVNPSVPAGT